jgi:ethanolamine permease
VEEGHLKKTLGPVTLWGLGVGYVISGEYFGWNLGLPEGGSYGMLAATLVITVMYVAFTLSYAEFACAIPRAGGVFVYAERALGPGAGLVAGLVQIIEFVFAPPAIAMAIGAYAAQKYKVDPRAVAILAYLIFTALNAWGVRQAALFELVVTVLAVIELGVFMTVVAPSFRVENFAQEALPKGWAGFFGCLPFAIWFYLGIEGVANVAEEARNPQRDIARGFGASIATLVVLALGVFVLAVGVGGWRAIVFPPGSTETSDAPLPLALAMVVSKASALYTLLLGIGLLGLIASFHGIILAAARATMEFGRAGYLPPAIGAIHPKTGTPVVALLANLIAGVIAILSGQTSEIITLSSFGALALYSIAMLSLFRLRKLEPDLERPFRAVGYPWLPALALMIAAISFVAMTWFNPKIALVFAGMIALGVVGRLRKRA